MVSDLVVDSLKENIGRVVGIYNNFDRYFEGIILDCDGQYLKFNDRKTGVRLLAVSEIKEVMMK